MYSIENDGLTLEYKLLYGCAHRDFDVANVVNNAVCLGESGVLRDSLEEQLRNLVVIGKLGPLSDHCSDSLLIREY